LELEPAQHGYRSLAHRFAHGCYVIVQPIDGGADQHSVVNRRDDLDPTFGAEAARYPEHVGGVCLRWEIQQRAVIHRIAIRLVYDPLSPPEDRRD
jgi:hypothetical protein